MRTTTTTTTFTCDQCSKVDGPLEGDVTAPSGWQPPITIGSAVRHFDSVTCVIAYFTAQESQQKA